MWVLAERNSVSRAWLCRTSERSDDIVISLFRARGQAWCGQRRQSPFPEASCPLEAMPADRIASTENGRPTNCMTIGRPDAKAISSANEGSPTDTRRVDRAIAASRTGIAVAPAAPPVAAAPSTSALLGGRNARIGAASFVCWLKAKTKTIGQHLRSIAAGAGLPHATWHRNLHRCALQTLCQCTDLLSGAALAA